MWEARLVEFIVAIAAVANKIDDDASLRRCHAVRNARDQRRPQLDRAAVHAGESESPYALPISVG